jgi:3-methyladenine DNA glycosylase AlkD
MTKYNSEYIEKIAAKFGENANPENARPMKKYMKGQFEYFGIKSPERKLILKKFFAKNDLPEFADLESIVTRLFQMPEREFQYFAIELCGKYKKLWIPKTLSIFEKMAVTKSWWDSVDYIKSVCFKPYFLMFPEDRYAITQRWIDSGNIWLQRLSIIYQLGYKEKTDLKLLQRNILRLNQSKEFFVQKAIGWSLRDYARTDADFVKKFVAENELKPLSKREALKNLRVVS